MKRKEEDKKIGEKLKHSAHEAGENQYFTRRVMNRLPDSVSAGAPSWLIGAVCFVAFLLSLAFLVVQIINFKSDIILVKDLMLIGTNIAISIALLIALICRVLRYEW